MSIARIGEIDVEYHIEGSGEPLALIMGFYGTADSWGRPFVDRLAKRFQVVRLSNRGTGQSSHNGSEISCGLMADDVAGLIDHLGIASAHVMGISMGARIAQELAIEHPEKVRRLVLASTDYGGRAAPAPEAVRAAMMKVATSGGRDGNEEFLPLCLAPARLDRGFALPEGILPARSDPDVLVKQLLAIRSFDTYDRLGRIRAETLVLQGGADQINRVENGQALCKRVAGSRFVRIEDAGHIFVWERPDEASRVVTEFVGTGKVRQEVGAG